MAETEKLELPTSWTTMLALGLVMVALGMIGMATSVFVTLASIIFFAVLMLVVGAAQLVHGLFGKDVKAWRQRLMHIVIAALYIVGGLLTLANPVAASLVLTAMLAGVFLAIGTYRVVVAWGLRKRGQPWLPLMVAGIAEIVLSAVIILGMPWTAFWVIGFLISLDLVFNGAYLISVALAKKAQESQVSA